MSKSPYDRVIQSPPDALNMNVVFDGLICLLGLSLLLTTNTLSADDALDRVYGPVNTSRYDNPLPIDGPDSHWEDVKSVLDSRCVACHACYDAPCQLKLGSYEGLTRGASPAKVYDAVRLFPADLTRLFVDADSNNEWRDKGFHAVLNERGSSTGANLDGSLLYRLLALKQDQSWPQAGALPADLFDFSTDRVQECVATDDFGAFKKDHPEWGMPYGLPPITARDHGTLIRWLSKGALAAKTAPPSDEVMAEVALWENLLNGRSAKGQLVGRFIYEHWYLAHLYFSDQPSSPYFELVRSKTPPGQPIDIIATRLPYSDPGVYKVYYRFRPVHETLVAKTHMPYRLNSERLKQINGWFFEPDYRVTSIPSYLPEVASNPFKVFKELPLDARYAFLLEEAQFTIMTFIKGPVCRGQVAVDVIQDHFWVVFTEPKHHETGTVIYESILENLRLPNEADATYNPLTSWIDYSEGETNYLKAKAEYLNRALQKQYAPTLDLIWHGDGHNSNAALTVFRHFDSASVVKGLIGERPQSIWVMGYPLLERIYYLLVAGFDVYGNTVHQLDSRLYMDFLRMEAEINTLGFLPKASRDEVRDRWYRGASQEVKDFVNGSKARFAQETGIHFNTSHPYQEFVGMLKDRFADLSDQRYDLSSSGLDEPSLSELRRLSRVQGRSASILPEASFLTIKDGRGVDHPLSLLRNSAHTNVAEMFKEADRRIPDEDTLTVANGFIGAYPNAFFSIGVDQLALFVEAVKALKSDADYSALLDRFGVRRTDPRFWDVSDSLNARYRRDQPIEAGWFDYSRLENR